MLSTVLTLSCDWVVDIGMVCSLAITHTEREKVISEWCCEGEGIRIGLIFKQKKAIFTQGALNV